MKQKDFIRQEEERLRGIVAELPQQKRIIYYKELEGQLKDPDTYAVLVYLSLSGVHSMYLGKIFKGIIELLVSFVGIALIFTPFQLIGVGIIVLISIYELPYLFRSQVIVADYNNKIMQKVYDKILAADGIRFIGAAKL